MITLTRDERLLAGARCSLCLVWTIGICVVTIVLRVPSLVAGTAEQMNEFCPCIYLDITSLKYCSNGLRLGCKGDVHLEKWAGALLNPILKLKWN